MRVCLFMADLEETAGAPGAVREWLSRAARAPRDRAWVADGLVSDRWAPASPIGRLDAFVWRAPEERLSAAREPTPAPSAVDIHPADAVAVVAPLAEEPPAKAAEVAPAAASVKTATIAPAEPPPRAPGGMIRARIRPRPNAAASGCFRDNRRRSKPIAIASNRNRLSTS